ncbi:MAG: cation:proton antiporter [Clostridia bacterium]|nr:cation:proton antiporter [Clostridia bacterium]
MEHNILFELGIVLFAGFFAALLMKKLGQSVIIGYMVVGLLIGPNTLGLVKETELLETLSQLGIVFLMFFLGLEFTIKKFKKIKNSVFFIGTYEVILNLLIGFLIGTLLGFPIKERLFFAGIIALSSSGVVAKLLFEMKRTASKESEILMGVMVFEDFFAIVLLGILSSFASDSSVQIGVIAQSIGLAILFYAVFIVIGILVIDRLTDLLLRIESQELFTALMLGVILLVGAFALKIGLASAAGAFLLGMIINSYDVEERLHRTVSAFKDIFLVVFFISFGMLLDPQQIPDILPLIAIVVPLTVLAELIVTSSSAFFSGFSAKSAVAIGSSMIARGEYSLIYASLGLATGAITKSLYQFTGLYVFVMTLIAPIAMKNSQKIKSVLTFTTPKFIKYGAKLISVTMKPILLPEESGVRVDRSYQFLVHFTLYLVSVISIIVISAYMQKSPYFIAIILLAAIGIYLVYRLRQLFASKIKRIEEQVDYHLLHQGPYNLDTIVRFISNLFSALLTIIILGASFWSFGSTVMASLLLLFVIYLFIVSIYVYRKTFKEI